MARAPTALVLILLAACGDRPEPAPAAGSPPPSPPSATQTPLADSVDAGLFARGRGVYDAICAECHAIEPPPLTAPTLREIVERYHEAYLEPAEALDHLTAYIREPVQARSQLPQVMIDEWGVMPPQPLPQADLAAVAYFIWHLPPPSPR